MLAGPSPTTRPCPTCSSSSRSSATGPICFAILRYSVASDAQRTESTPRVAGSLVPRLARNLPQYRGHYLPSADRRPRAPLGGGKHENAAGVVRALMTRCEKPPRGAAAGREDGEVNP